MRIALVVALSLIFAGCLATPTPQTNSANTPESDSAAEATIDQAVRTSGDFVYGFEVTAEESTSCSGAVNAITHASHGVIFAVLDSVGESHMYYRSNAGNDGFYVGPAGQGLGYYETGYGRIDVDAKPFVGTRTIWTIVPTGSIASQVYFDIHCPGAEISRYWAGTDVESFSWLDNGDSFVDRGVTAQVAVADKMSREFDGDVVAWAVMDNADSGAVLLDTPEGPQQWLLPEGREGVGGPGLYELSGSSEGGYLLGIFGSAVEIPDGPAWLDNLQ